MALAVGGPCRMNEGIPLGRYHGFVPAIRTGENPAMNRKRLAAKLLINRTLHHEPAIRARTAGRAVGQFKLRVQGGSSS